MNARIIILNGSSSVGKTSAARALQAITAAPFLYVAMDAFLEMLPPALLADEAGILFETIDDGPSPSVVIKTGPVGERTLRGMRHAVAAMADQGNDLIVDEVMVGQGQAGHYRALLARHTVHFVGLFAPLAVLEARERQRGDRMIGLARWLHQRVHQGVTYDLEIDTAAAPAIVCAHTIKAAFGL